MNSGNGHAKTLPQALVADIGVLEDVAKRLTQYEEKLKRIDSLNNLVIKLAHSIDLTREDQRQTITQVGALAVAVEKLNTSVQQVISYLVPGDAKPTPPDSPLARTQPSARRRK